MSTMSQSQSSSTRPVLSVPYGIVAEFDTPAAAMHCAEHVRDAGFTRWDVYSPFPVHGMDAAMGLKNTQIVEELNASHSGPSVMIRTLPATTTRPAGQRPVPAPPSGP